MAKLIPRYTAYELERLTAAIYPEERRGEFTDQPWNGEGFRHWLDPRIVPIEHYWPRTKPILPEALHKSG
jgi:hypothetical protein